MASILITSKNRIKHKVSHCFYCEDYLPLDERTIDHITPKSKGGKSSQSNLVVACGECNSAKSNFDIHEFRYILSKKLKHKEAFGKIPADRIEVVYKNVVRLAEGNRYDSDTATLTTSFDAYFENKAAKPTKLERGEISQFYEPVFSEILDPVTVRVKKSRLQQVAALEAKHGYVYDESHIHKSFHEE